MSKGIGALNFRLFGRASGPHSDEPSGSRALFHSDVPIEGMKNGETYADYDRRRHGISQTGFGGFGCAGGCERHEAGYRWAEEQRITKPRHCRGPTWEFVEGCAVCISEGARD